MNRLTTAIAIMTVFLAGAPAAFSQQGITWRGAGGWGPGTSYARLYDPQAIETIAGEVLSVESFTPAKGMSYGVHLMVKTAKETIPVHLGPAWFIENQDVKVLPADRIEVRGSRITYEGKPAMVAVTVTKGSEMLELRDAGGFPAWSGWRRR